MISEVTRNSGCVAEWMKERTSEADGHTRGVSWACERQCLVRGGGGEVPIKEVRGKKGKKDTVGAGVGRGASTEDLGWTGTPCCEYGSHGLRGEWGCHGELAVAW